MRARQQADRLPRATVRELHPREAAPTAVEPFDIEQVFTPEMRDAVRFALTRYKEECADNPSDLGVREKFGSIATDISLLLGPGHHAEFGIDGPEAVAIVLKYLTPIIESRKEGIENDSLDIYDYSGYVSSLRYLAPTRFAEYASPDFCAALQQKIHQARADQNPQMLASSLGAAATLFPNQLAAELDQSEDFRMIAGAMAESEETLNAVIFPTACAFPTRRQQIPNFEDVIAKFRTDTIKDLASAQWSIGLVEALALRDATNAEVRYTPTGVVVKDSVTANTAPDLPARNAA